MASKNVLLVEGPDDKHFVHHLRLRKGLTNSSFYIKEKGGVNTLLDKLDAEVDASELERLGILVDANGNLNARWQSIRDRLHSLGYEDAPSKANREGMFVKKQGVRPSVGIWIMPNNQDAGYLESFYIGLIQPDELEKLAWGAIQHIPDSLRKFPLNHEVKAVVHTWLAWQEEPGKPMGQAVQKGYVDLNHASINSFMNWLNKTFDLGVK